MEPPANPSAGPSSLAVSNSNLTTDRSTSSLDGGFSERRRSQTDSPASESAKPEGEIVEQMLEELQKKSCWSKFGERAASCFPWAMQRTPEPLPQNPAKLPVEEADVDVLADLCSGPIGSRTSRAVDGMTSVLGNFLFLGSDADARDLQALKRTDIGFVLNCAPLDTITDRKAYERQGYSYLALEIMDSENFNLRAVMPQAFDFIDAAYVSESRVLVFCRGGRSRSAAVVAAYLMRVRKLTAQQALQYVLQRRPNVCPNRGFLRQLLGFQKELRIE